MPGSWQPQGRRLVGEVALAGLLETERGYQSDESERGGVRETLVERLLAVLPVFPLRPGALGYRVVTRDPRSFGRIPGLDVVVL